jgi:hypothetical protein
VLAQQDCLWLVEESDISCWDDETLQPRFRIQEAEMVRCVRRPGNVEETAEADSFSGWW